MESFEGLDNELKKNPLLDWEPMKGPKKRRGMSTTGLFQNYYWVVFRITTGWFQNYLIKSKI